jgi:NADH-quinone oxidoreductase subunit D
MATRAVTLGVGSLASGMVPEYGTEALVADLGPAHPSMHGLLRVRLNLDDADVVTAAEPLIGSMHRGAEKLLEVRDYRQALALVNRHDWHGAFSSELGLALALERMLGIDVPERATWARTLLSELTRALSHLAFLGTFPGVPGSLGHGHAQREALLAVVEEATGGRMHTMAVQVGGLKQDLPAGWLARVRDAVASVRRDLAGFDAAVAEPAFVAATRGTGVLTRDDAIAFGTSGPVARASGLDLDLRRDDPYCAYGELREVLRVVTRTEGDSLARVQVLLEQLHVSLDLADACVGALESSPPGPIHVRLPKVLRAPEGHAYAATENPSGINGYLLVSRGEKTPWRLKIRSGSFANVAALTAALPGTALADVPTVLASFAYVVGDIDR